MSKAILALGIVLLVTTAATGTFAFTTSKAVSDPRWEYMILSVPDDMFTQQLDRLGANGWEMVFARRASDGNTPHPTMSYEMIFKRHATATPLENAKAPKLLP
jgi:hypothetical protein